MPQGAVDPLDKTETSDIIFSVMTNETRKQAENILLTLERQQFADWYTAGKFDTYITGEFPKGDPRRPSKEDILKDIVRLFRLDRD